MKKKLFCLLLLFILPVCLLFTGCEDAVEIKDEEPEKLMLCIERFEMGGCGCYILVHKETRIMYMAYYQGGMTVMYDVDGKPLIYEGEL